jgi:hypothetical protein
MKFRSRKKKKMTKKELKDREVRRRLRYIDWLNSPKVCFLFSIIVNIMNGLLTV